MQQHPAGPVRIGIDLGGTKIEALAIDDQGRELARQRIASPAHDYALTLAAIRGLVDGIEAALGVRARVGIGTPGAVSPATRPGQERQLDPAQRPPRSSPTWRRRSAARCGSPTTPTASPSPRRATAPAPAGAWSSASSSAPASAAAWSSTAGCGPARTRSPASGATTSCRRGPRQPCPTRAATAAAAAASRPMCRGPALAADHARVAGAASADVDARRIVALARAGDARSAGDAGSLLPAPGERARHRDQRRRPRRHRPRRRPVAGRRALSRRCRALLGEYVFSDRCDTPVVRNRHGDASGVRGAAWLWPAREAG